MTGLLSRATPTGLVDLVAVERWVRGDDVDLTEAERPVAIHAARGAGRSIDWIAKRLRTHDKNVKAVLAEGVPRDSSRRPLVPTITL